MCSVHRRILPQGPFVVPLDDGANKAPATPDGQTAKRGFLFPGPARTARDGWIASGATAEAWGRGNRLQPGVLGPPTCQLLLVQVLRHRQMALERRGGRGRPILQPSIGPALAIALEQRDGVLVRADLVAVVLLVEVGAM
jgi:hypothetical protein